MPKSRMTALDVRAMVTDIKPLCLRLRVANVYDISSKVYVLKLSEGEVKRHLVLQSGTRFHLSDWKRDKQSIPSVFTMRLRKYLRTKRVTNMEQLGFDRVLDLTFGHGDQAHHLIVEFYAKGNVVLTDHEYIVTSSWRQFKSDDVFAVRLNEKYPIEEYSKPDRFVLPGIQCVLSQDDKSQLLVALQETLRKEKEALTESLALPLKNKEKKEKQNCLDTDSLVLAEVIGKLCPVAHKAIIDHVMEQLGLDPQMRANMSDGSSALESVSSILQQLVKIWSLVSTSEQKQQLRPRVTTDESPSCEALTTTTSAASEGLVETTIKGYIFEPSPGIYEDFSPLPIGSKSFKEYPSFHECVDQYFSSLEVGKAEKAKSEKLTELESKIKKIRDDQNERVENLKLERDLCEKQAVCVEYQITFVGRALEMMQRMVQSGSDWSLIEKLVKEQRRNNHPICTYIQSMQLKEGKFTLLLQDTMYGLNEDEREIEEDAPLIPVPLTIADSAFQNVKNLHDTKKQSQAKYLKTEAAAHRVISQAEQAAARLKKTKELSTETRPQIRKLRKTFWFERFYWFISSDGFLVLAGHDAIENEILYKKYLRKADLFVHADVHGAATCIIRNGSGGEVPKTTIDEAGTFSVCRSNAWKSKVLVAAYWVFAHQVSKTPQAGEFVATGGFIIRGQRNPIIVKKLEMGLGVYFHLGDDESIKRHLHHPEAISGDTTPTSLHPDPQQSDRSQMEHKSESKSLRTGLPENSLSPAQMKGEQFAVPNEELEAELLSNSEVESSGVAAGGDSDYNSESPTRAHEVDVGAPEGGSAEQRDSGSGDSDDASVSRPPNLSSTSTRVQWGLSEVLPTPAIQQRVEFDELPPEVIVVHSERSILSDDENHWILRGEHEYDTISEFPGCPDRDSRQRALTTRGTEGSSFNGAENGLPPLKRRLPRELRRPDSADELPPPSTYLGRTAPKDLLAKRTPETAPMSQASESESEFDLEHNLYMARAQTERQPHRSVPIITSPFRETLPAQSLPCRRRRRRAVDGGPPPRGFLEFEVPPVRDLLRFGSRHSVREDENASAAAAHVSLAFPGISKPGDAVRIPSTAPVIKIVDSQIEGSEEPSTGLFNVGHDGDGEGEISPSSVKEDVSPKGGRKRMSKAERKHLKKGKGADGAEERKGAAESGLHGEHAQVDPSNEKKLQKHQPVPRGKRQKLKRMKKYAEQSDDEKEMAMRLIGAKKMKEQSEVKEDTAESQLAQRLDNVWERDASKAVPAAPDRNIAEEESDDEVQNEEWKKRLEVLHELTGQPTTEDTIISALPVCAPYPALKTFTYKGRVLPGGGKKGLAVKHALQAFVEMSPAGSIERELIKQISADELSACLVANPIVQIQGMDKVLKAEKQAKKAEKKVNKEATRKL